MKIKIGDTIRSFDFQPCADHPINYMEGVVWKIDNTFVWFNPSVVVRQGCLTPLGKKNNKYWDTTRTPRPDVETLFEYEGRITIISEVK